MLILAGTGESKTAEQTTKEVLPAAPMEGQNGRMVKLTGALNIALDKSLRPVTFQAFSSCFPQHLVDANPQLFMAAHQNYIDILRTNIEVDLCESLI